MRALICLLCVASVWSYQSFQDAIPNGDNVPHPCKANFIWRGVGHRNPLGGGARNPFGLDFLAAGKKWTKGLCEKDSDGDGLTNGEELGDPNCVWKKGDAPEVTLGLSHPGICTPYSAPTCQAANSWIDCDLGELECDAIHERGTKNITVRFPPTAVPNTETNYYCMMFDLPTDGDYHMIATKPYIDNENVLHHILVHGCDESEGPITDFPMNTPMPCGMGAHRKCSILIGVWAVGFPGECNHKDVGFRIGQNGFRKATFQIHWNNPELRSDYTDSSGMTFYYTENRRVNDATILMIGQNYLSIPPGQESVKTEGWCSSDCSAKMMAGPVYITRALNHMHYMGRQQRIEHFRDGVKIGDLSYDEFYSYDSPVLHDFQEPVEFRPGDEIKTTCTFKSIGKDRTTFQGDGTNDEMCYGFLTVFPAANMLSPMCVSWKSIGECKLYGPFSKDFPVINGCNVREFTNSSHPKTMELGATIFSLCKPFQPCLEECKSYIKNVLANNTCLFGDLADYYRMFAHYDPEAALLWAALDSCKTEIELESYRMSQPDNSCITSGVTVQMVSLSILLLSYLLSKLFI